MRRLLKRGRTRVVAGMLALAPSASCIDATDVDLLEIPATGVVFGQAFLDANGTGAVDAGDSPLVGAGVLLVAPGTGATVAEVTTDALGAFLFEDVPLGTYQLSLDAAVLGDSLTTVSATSTANVEFGDTLVVEIGATYPTLTLAEVRAAPPGRRVFTHGIALNARQSNGDGVVHLQEGATFLRATGVAPLGLAANDSVRLRGSTAVDVGQPTLADVTAFVLRANAVFVTPQVVTLAQANSAGGGALDAALVRFGPAEIGDTVTVGSERRFWAHDGADSVQVALRDYLLISPNPPIRPDTIVRLVQLTGLLRPYTDASGTRWRLLPRGPGDVVTETKTADIGVLTSFSATAATAGDTVEIRVVVRNGPGTFATHVANGVVVSDTVPAALSYVSATATRGAYDPATRLWTVGDLPPGVVADTLRIRAEVIGAPGLVENRAWFQGLVSEAEANPGNNAGATNPDLTIS